MDADSLFSLITYAIHNHALLCISLDLSKYIATLIFTYLSIRPPLQDHRFKSDMWFIEKEIHSIKDSYSNYTNASENDQNMKYVVSLFLTAWKIYTAYCG